MREDEKIETKKAEFARSMDVEKAMSRLRLESGVWLGLNTFTLKDDMSLTLPLRDGTLRFFRLLHPSSVA